MKLRMRNLNGEIELNKPKMKSKVPVIDDDGT